MMKYVLMIVFVILVASSIYYYQLKNSLSSSFQSQPSKTTITDPDTPEITTLAEGLDTPWAIVFLPDNSLLITERKGTVRRISDDQLDPAPVATLENVLEIGEGGLLGMTLHPEFEENNFIYFYYTYQNAGDNTLNRVVRMTYQNNTLANNEEIIVDEIPGGSNHNGGRIKFGPDNLLYITTGDAQDPSQAQDINSLAGKILRVTDVGEPAPDNPFNNRVYSYGHRNPQGLAWDAGGNLWSTEHGRSGIQSGLDEVNLIQAGKNYGWPEIEGDETRVGMETPIIHSGGNNTWAPGSIAIYNNRLFFGGLRGNALFEGTITDNNIDAINSHYKGEYGRIREAIVGPDSMLYITTSNQDGRGRPNSSDDRILRINPKTL